LLTKKLAGSLEELTFEEKQKIIQLLVEETRVHAGHVEIHYIMPLSGNLHLQSRSLPTCHAKRPPPPQAQPQLAMAAEERVEYL